jgi:hypothetical protein
LDIAKHNILTRESHVDTTVKILRQEDYEDYKKFQNLYSYNQDETLALINSESPNKDFLKGSLTPIKEGDISNNSNKLRRSIKGSRMDVSDGTPSAAKSPYENNCSRNPKKMSAFDLQSYIIKRDANA